MISRILTACLVMGCFHFITCSDPVRNVRLVGGFNKYEGRVEVFWNDTWGTICDDQWDRRDAWVICKELGFGSPLQIASTAHFGSGPGPILLDNLDCTGQETNILNCSHSGIGVHDCTHFEDAGVACSPPVVCLTDPCEEGICVDSGDSFHCICTPGYTGVLCDQEVTCDLPEIAPPGAHFVSPRDHYSYREIVRVSCTNGPGSTSWTCNEYGQWNSHYIACGAYRSAATHSYTVIGIGSALVVIGVAVFIFAIFMLIRHKRHRQVESLYEISNLETLGARMETVQSAYLTMTGGTSPMPSPRRSSSVLSTDPLIKSPRANMALPPTPTDLVRSPLSPSLSVPASDCIREIEARPERRQTGNLAERRPSGNQAERRPSGNQTEQPPSYNQVEKQVAKQAEKQVAKQAENHITKQSVKPIQKPTEAPAPSNITPHKQPVAPARARKQNNEQRSKPLFKFPPPPIPTTPAPSKTLRADVTKSAANGSMRHTDKSKLLSAQRSVEEETSLITCPHVSVVSSHFNDEQEYQNSMKDTLNTNVQSPYASI